MGPRASMSHRQSIYEAPWAWRLPFGNLPLRPYNRSEASMSHRQSIYEAPGPGASFGNLPLRPYNRSGAPMSHRQSMYEVPGPGFLWGISLYARITDLGPLCRMDNPYMKPLGLGASLGGSPLRPYNRSGASMSHRQSMYEVPGPGASPSGISLYARITDLRPLCRIDNPCMKPPGPGASLRGISLCARITDLGASMSHGQSMYEVPRPRASLRESPSSPV